MDVGGIYCKLTGEDLKCLLYTGVDGYYWPPQMVLFCAVYDVAGQCLYSGVYRECSPKQHAPESFMVDIQQYMNRHTFLRIKLVTNFAPCYSCAYNLVKFAHMFREKITLDYYMSYPYNSGNVDSDKSVYQMMKEGIGLHACDDHMRQVILFSQFGLDYEHLFSSAARDMSHMNKREILARAILSTFYSPYPRLQKAELTELLYESKYNRMKMLLNYFGLRYNAFLHSERREADSRTGAALRVIKSKYTLSSTTLGQGFGYKW